MIFRPLNATFASALVLAVCLALPSVAGAYGGYAVQTVIGTYSVNGVPRLTVCSNRVTVVKTTTPLIDHGKVSVTSQTSCSTGNIGATGSGSVIAPYQGTTVATGSSFDYQPLGDRTATTYTYADLSSYPSTMFFTAKLVTQFSLPPNLGAKWLYASTGTAGTGPGGCVIVIEQAYCSLQTTPYFTNLETDTAVTDTENAAIDTGLLDEDGDAPTTAVLVDTDGLGPSVPLGPSSSPLLLYADGTAGGSLTAEGATESGASSVGSGGAPVSTGSCRMYPPDLYRLYDRDRHQKGDPYYAYVGQVRTECTNAVASASCYLEQWLAKGPVLKDQQRLADNLGNGQKGCHANTYDGFYRGPRKHYAKSAITMYAPPGHFWGSGRGPQGWDCQGQNTRQVTCRRDTAPMS